MTKENQHQNLENKAIQFLLPLATFSPAFSNLFCTECSFGDRFTIFLLVQDVFCPIFVAGGVFRLTVPGRICLESDATGKVFENSGSCDELGLRFQTPLATRTTHLLCYQVDVEERHQERIRMAHCAHSHDTETPHVSGPPLARCRRGLVFS